MRCTHAEKLIPLYAGDDLHAREAAALRRHLESCANCRRLAAEFEESRDWLRGFPTPKFDVAMLDDMRDSVLSGIGQVENRARWVHWIIPGWNLRFAFATSLALLLLITWLGLMIARRQQQSDPGHNRADAQKDDGQKVEFPSDKNLNDVTTSGQSPAKAKNDRHGSARKTVRSKLNKSPQGMPRMVERDPSNTDLAASRDTLRIEIQTADPNIRIIWFAQKTGVSPISSP
jgi:hypothetical protein